MSWCHRMFGECLAAQEDRCKEESASEQSLAVIGSRRYGLCGAKISTPDVPPPPPSLWSFWFPRTPPISDTFTFASQHRHSSTDGSDKGTAKKDKAKTPSANDAAKSCVAV